MAPLATPPPAPRCRPSLQLAFAAALAFLCFAPSSALASGVGKIMALIQQALGGKPLPAAGPTADGDALVYDSTTGKLVWEAPGGSGSGLFHVWLDPRDGVAPAGTSSLAMSLYSTRNGHPVQEFPASEEDSTEDDSCEWVFRLPSTFSSSNNVQVDILWAAEGATSGDVIWVIEVEAFGATELDIDSSSFDTAQTVTTTTSGTDGNTVLSSKQHTNGEFDGCAGGDYVRIRITRDSNNISDTLAVRAQLLGVAVEEETP